MFRNAALVAVFSVLLSPAAMLAGKKQSLPAGLRQAGVISAILRNATLSRSTADPAVDYGTPIAWNDTLRTNGNGRIRVTLANNSTISAGTDSEVVFLEENSGNISLKLNFGQMRVRAAENEVLVVRTPEAIVTGKGSDFAIDASVSGRVRIICLEGTVTITTPEHSDASECDAGEIVTAKAGKAPYQPQLADVTTLGIARNITDPEEQAPVQYFP